MKYYTEIKEHFEEYHKHYFQKEPLSLYSPINYAMESGGKYIRPLLMLYAAELFTDNVDSIYSNAYGIELFHNFTLLHDDIMDNSEIRRGKESVYKKYGLNSGILSGDLMLILSLQIASKLNGKTNAALFDLVSETAIEIHEGQQMDVDFETQNWIEESAYLKMIEFKTAVLLACSLKMGAFIAGASEDDQNKLYEFGRLMGIAFQIKDDVLDAFGDEKVGKKIGGDILNNKKTLLFISSMHLANDGQKQILNEQFANNSQSEEKITVVKELFVQTGGKDYCMNKINQLHAEAIQILNSVNTSKSKQALEDIANLIVDRVH